MATASEKRPLLAWSMIGGYTGQTNRVSGSRDRESATIWREVRPEGRAAKA